MENKINFKTILLLGFSLLLLNIFSIISFAGTYENIAIKNNEKGPGMTGWIYEAHASAEESYPSVYLADFLWVPGHKEADSFIRLFCPPQTNWNPVEYRGKRLYITGDISYEYIPENGTQSYSLFLVPNMIDTMPQ